MWGKFSTNPGFFGRNQLLVPGVFPGAASCSKSWAERWVLSQPQRQFESVWSLCLLVSKWDTGKIIFCCCAWRKMHFQIRVFYFFCRTRYCWRTCTTCPGVSLTRWALRPQPVWRVWLQRCGHDNLICLLEYRCCQRQIGKPLLLPKLQVKERKFPKKIPTFCDGGMILREDELSRMTLPKPFFLP